jgi:hypothetical protein
MKWKIDKLKNGTVRVFRYFALFPTELDDGYTVWLQFYYSKKVWRDGGGTPYFSEWETVKTSVVHPDRPTTGSQL